MRKKEIDFLLTLLISVIIIFGVIMVSSVSVYSSYTTTLKLVERGILSEPSNTYFLTKTLSHVFVGFVIMTIMAKIPYQNLEKSSFYFYVWSLGLLLFVLFFGETIKWAKWWIHIPWLPSIQPVEIAKLGIILFLAYFMKKRRPVMKDFKLGFLSFFLYAWLPLLLLVLQPDFWSILILTPIIFAMYFIGGWQKKFLAYSILFALIGASLVYSIWKVQLDDYLKQSNEITSSTDSQNKKSPFLRLGYISQRIDNFFRSDMDISKSKKDSDAQLKQWFIALGSWWFFWLWIASSIQKYGYLPEVQWDFIFSIIIEEFGFIWWFLLILIYMLIAYRWFYIARSVNDLFWKYVAFGITTWFIVQTFINIWVNLNVVPLTWVTLPFISYWWSSIVMLCLSAWVLLSISRNVEYKSQNISDAVQARRKKIIF